MTRADVRVFATADLLAPAVAREIANVLTVTIRRQGSASLVLAGGHTPRAVYRQLAARAGEAAWQQVHVYWGDERLVAHDDERSNYRMARESLLDALPVRPERVHPMPTDVAPDRAADEYERTLRVRFTGEWPEFDLVLLGIGEDGHTASLFSGSPALRESARWVAVAHAPSEPRDRLTLTVQALTHASEIFVLAVGASKAEAVRRALNEAPSAACPASLLRQSRGRVTWWLDGAAAHGLAPRATS